MSADSARAVAERLARELPPRIGSFRDLVGFVRADLQRHGRPLEAWLRHPQARWLVRLRVAEWCSRGGRGPAGRLAGAVLRHRANQTGARLGITLPAGTAGPGLRLPHVGTITVNAAARIGANCQLCQGVTVGGARGGVPTLEDDVYVGPNAVILGPVTVGAGAVIGGGAVIVDDVPAGSVWVAHAARRIR